MSKLAQVPLAEVPLAQVQLAEAPYQAMMRELRADFIRNELKIKKPKMSEEEREEEVKMFIKFFEEQIEREEKLRKAIAAGEQQQVPQNPKKRKLGAFNELGGGRRKYNKSPRHINKTRRSGKSPRKSRRLYKSRKRHR